MATVVVQMSVYFFMCVIISIPFGVSQDRLKAFQHQLEKYFVEVDGGLHERILYQEPLSRQWYKCRLSFFEKVSEMLVHTIFGRVTDFYLDAFLKHSFFEYIVGGIDAFLCILIRIGNNMGSGEDLLDTP